jgi:2-methylcitrate dehydratase
MLKSPSSIARSVYAAAAMTILEQLAQLVASFDASSLPARVVEHTKLLLLDTIGCAIAATPEDSCQAVINAAAQMGSGDCTVIGSTARLSPPNAVLANGGLIRILDLNDSYWGPNSLSGHPSDNIAVALAAGEWQDSSGREVLTAIILGYEIDGRVSDLTPKGSVWDYSMRTRLVAPTMAGRLMSLDAERLTHALGLSAMAGPSLAIARQGHISAAKWLATAMAGQAGVAAAMLAANGLAGPRSALEGPAGWAQAVLPEADLAQVAAPLEGEFRIEHASIKAYPSVGTSQAVVAAALQARAAMGGHKPDVERVEVRMADTQMVRTQVASEERHWPTSREAADHGFWFLIAAALLDGEMTTHQFDNERWRQPEVLALMERIDIQCDASLNRYAADSFPAALKLILKSGESREIEVPYPPGHHRAGMTPDVVTAKFKAFTSGLIPAERQAQIIAAAMSIDQAPSVRPLMRLLAA